MHRFSCFSRRFLVGLGFCGLLAFVAVPARAQETNAPHITSLSDVSGPFLGNVPPTNVPVSPPPPIGVSISTLDNTTRDILFLPPEQQLNLGDLLKICVHLSESMAKVAPFSGCSNVNWKAYNRAVSDSKQLNRELVSAVRTQKTALGANPSPDEREVIVQRMALIERTTTALETTTSALSILGRAMDKAR